MDASQEQKKRVRHPDRVTLLPEALTRISEWANELEKHLKGSRVTKSDLVNFLVLSHSARLTESEISQLRSQHFDEVRFAEWATRELKKAKAQGKSLTLAEVLGQSRENPMEDKEIQAKDKVHVKKGLTP